MPFGPFRPPSGLFGPFGPFDFGVRCRACGKFINGLVQAFPVMPDPFRVTCPYCGTTASYEKTAIENVSGSAPEYKLGILVIALIAIAALIAAITRWGS